ncbi:hypothetical protein MTO96_043821 [Rhipicephalus appendiculatus]
MTEQSQQYAIQLARHNWRNFGDKLQGTLGTKQMQRLLRALRMEGLAKMSTNTQLQRFGGRPIPPSIKQAPRSRPISENPPQTKKYESIPNANLHRPFTPAKLPAAIYKFTRRASAGKDRTDNKLVQELPNQALSALLRYYNKCCDK